MKTLLSMTATILMFMTMAANAEPKRQHQVPLGDTPWTVTDASWYHRDAPKKKEEPRQGSEDKTPTPSSR